MRREQKRQKRDGVIRLEVFFCYGRTPGGGKVCRKEKDQGNKKRLAEEDKTYIGIEINVGETQKEMVLNKIRSGEAKRKNAAEKP